MRIKRCSGRNKPRAKGAVACAQTWNGIGTGDCCPGRTVAAGRGAAAHVVKRRAVLARVGEAAPAQPGRRGAPGLPGLRRRRFGDARGVVGATAHVGEGLRLSEDHGCGWCVRGGSVGRVRGVAGCEEADDMSAGCCARARRRGSEYILEKGETAGAGAQRHRRTSARIKAATSAICQGLRRKGERRVSDSPKS